MARRSPFVTGRQHSGWLRHGPLSLGHRNGPFGCGLTSRQTSVWNSMAPAASESAGVLIGVDG